jgi:hypothetical protein
MRSCLIVLMLVLAGCATSRGPDTYTAVDTGSLEKTRAAFQTGAEKFGQQEYEDADRQFRAVLGSRWFDALSPRERHGAEFLGGVAALERDDAARAHNLLVRATQSSESDGEDWYQRFRAAYGRDLKDALLCLTTLAQRWPDLLGRFEDWVVPRTAYDAEKIDALTDARFALLQALFEAEWTLGQGEEPSGLWASLIDLHLQRHSVEQAIEVASHVNDPYTLIGLRVDNRYDELRRALPGRFDIEKAMREENQFLADAAVRNPRSLEALSRLAWSMLCANRYEDALALTGHTIELAKTDPETWDDLDDQLPWIMDNHSRALMGLNRWDEAVEQLAAAAALPERGGPNVSNAINLGYAYAVIDRPADALKAVAEVAKSGKASPYGLMQLESVRLASALDSGDTAARNKSLDYLRKHRADAESTLLWMLVWANELDEAARILIERLEEPRSRRDALVELQSYIEPPAPPRLMQYREHWAALLARPDVRAAASRAGTVQSFSIAPNPS